MAVAGGHWHEHLWAALQAKRKLLCATSANILVFKWALARGPIRWTLSSTALVDRELASEATRELFFGEDNHVGNTQ